MLPSRYLIPLGRAIYAMRWGLVPLYLGLWAAIVAYNVVFLMEVGHIAVTVWHAVWTGNVQELGEALLLSVVTLVDMVMVANFVYMTSTGGYSIFVSEFNIKTLPDRPRWMNGLDSSMLKIQMGKSLMGVSSVHLLGTFLNAKNVSREQYQIEIVIHMTFIVTTLSYAWLARLTHGHQPKPGQHDEDDAPHAAAPHIHQPTPEPVH